MEAESASGCGSMECKLCPISKGTCEGPCVFAEILDKISLGFIGLDTERQEVFFLNEKAAEILQGHIDPHDFKSVKELLIGKANPCGVTHAGQVAMADMVQLGDRMIGFTAYCFSGKTFWINLADITHQERLKSIAEAVNMMNNTGYIFSGIRHELGNPLNSMKMAMEVLKRNIDRFDRETDVEYVDRAMTEIDRAGYLLKALRSFSMYERLNIEALNVDAFFETLLSMVRTDFADKRIQINAQIDPARIKVLADARALQQVLINLLTNASDALIDIKMPEIHIGVGVHDGHVLCVLRDNGRGMSAQQLEDAFKPFFTNTSTAQDLA